MQINPRIHRRLHKSAGHFHYHPSAWLHVVCGSLPWRHNDRHDVQNQWRLDCLLNRVFRRRSKTCQRYASLAFWGEYIIYVPANEKSTLVQVTITWANADLELCCHMSSKGYSELKILQWANNHERPSIGFRHHVMLANNDFPGCCNIKTWCLIHDIEASPFIPHWFICSAGV